MRAVLLILVLLLSARAGSAQQLIVRVVDDQARRAVQGASAKLLDGDSTVVASATADKDGFVRLRHSVRGSYRLLIEHAAFSPLIRPVTAAEGDVTLPALVMKSTAIALAPVTVTAEAPRNSVVDPVDPVMTRSSEVVSGARLAMLERMGISATGLLKELGGGLRVRRHSRKQTMCVESIRAVMSANPQASGCDWVAVILNGSAITDPEDFLLHMRADEFESIQYVPPLEAGRLYGLRSSATGAIVVWMRGSGPYQNAARTPK